MWMRAGLHGELIDSVDGHRSRHGVAAALLGDVGDRHAFDVVLVQVGGAGASVDARVSVIGAGSSVVVRVFLDAGHQVLEGGGVARATIHRERELRIEFVLNGSAGGRVGRVQHGGSIGDGDGGALSADGQLQGQSKDRGVVDRDILLHQALKAFGDDFNVVLAGLQRLDGIRSCTTGDA